jgi:hypothetical protein
MGKCQTGRQGEVETRRQGEERGRLLVSSSPRSFSAWFDARGSAAADSFAGRFAGGAFGGEGAGGAVGGVFPADLVCDVADEVAEKSGLGLRDLMLQAGADDFEVVLIFLDQTETTKQAQGWGVERNGVSAQRVQHHPRHGVIIGGLEAGKLLCSLFQPFFVQRFEIE